MGHQLVNQFGGRIALNPEQTLFNPDANKRYLDFFVGGAALGGRLVTSAGPADWKDIAPKAKAPLYLCQLNGRLTNTISTTEFDLIRSATDWRLA